MGFYKLLTFILLILLTQSILFQPTWKVTTTDAICVYVYICIICIYLLYKKIGWFLRHLQDIEWKPLHKSYPYKLLEQSEQ